MGWIDLVLQSLFFGGLVLGIAQIMRRWELLRYTRQMLAREFRDDQMAPVALLVPCKGIETGLEENLRALFEQDHPDYEIVFVVEDAADPATAVIEGLRREYRFVPSRLVVAGQASRHGQKVHNLLAATANLAERIKILAFVDSDARPGPTWLRSLAYHLGSKDVYVRTGYRWFIPQRRTLANIVLAAVNNTLATYFGRWRWNLVWGGSWAIWRQAFDSTAVRDAWQGTLCDDLVATRTVSSSGLRIHFEPRCMTASYIDMTWPQVCEFLRRQCLLGRFYVHCRWVLMGLGAGFWQLAFWGHLAALVACGSFAPRQWPWYAAATATLYVVGTARAWMGQQAFRKRFRQFRKQLAPVHAVELWLHPLTGLFYCLVVLSSTIGNTIRWRGIRYFLSRGGQSMILGRPWTPGGEASDNATQPTVIYARIRHTDAMPVDKSCSGRSRESHPQEATHAAPTALHPRQSR